MKNRHYFKLYESHFERYGKTFEDSIRGQKTTNTIEPVNIQHVAAIACDDYVKDPKRTRALTPLLGPCVLSDGPIRKWSRALVKSVFVRAELSDVDRLATFTDRFLNYFPATGRPMNALLPNIPAGITEFLQAWTKALRWAGNGGTPSKVHQYIDQHVERALSETREEDETGSDSPTVRKRYVLLDELAKRIRDPVQLRYQVLGVFLPAHNSTSVLVGNVLFELARHPSIWTRLRQISLQVDEDLSFEKLKSLAEFRYVVLETIRLIGPAARVVRIAIRDTFLPSGGGFDGKGPVFVAKGTAVSLGTWGVQHDGDIWGEDVQEFKPER